MGGILPSRNGKCTRFPGNQPDCPPGQNRPHPFHRMGASGRIPARQDAARCSAGLSRMIRIGELTVNGRIPGAFLPAVNFLTMNPNTRTTARRTFLKSGLAATAAPFLLPSRVWAADGSPNAKIRMAFIGTGKQNGGLMRGFMGNMDEVQVMAVCDVDTTRREHAKKTVLDFYASKGRTEKIDAYNDFREVLARKDIDAVCIATPDHWHAIITTAALASGKDVYCEKPLVHSVEEAVAVMDGVKRHNRSVLQTGSMQRSSKEFRAACEVVRNGFIGEVKSVICQFGGSRQTVRPAGTTRRTRSGLGPLARAGPFPSLQLGAFPARGA